MTPAACIEQLSARGVRLWVEGIALKYQAPRGALTDELREAVRANRVEIIKALEGVPEACPTCSSPIAAVIGEDGGLACGCHSSNGEHFHKRLFQGADQIQGNGRAESPVGYCECGATGLRFTYCDTCEQFIISRG